MMTRKTGLMFKANWPPLISNAEAARPRHSSWACVESAVSRDCCSLYAQIAREDARRARSAHRQSRREIFEMLQALRWQGLTYSEIPKRAGYERRRVTNWLASNVPRDRNRAALNPIAPLYFEAFLAA